MPMGNPARSSKTTSPSALGDASAELTEACENLAWVLVREGHLSKDQVRYAQRIQSKLATPKTLLDVLYELGLVTPERIREILSSGKVSLRLGSLLVLLGHIGVAELNAALSIQAQSGGKKPLGRVLVEGHYLEERKLCEALSFQLRIPFLQPSYRDLEPEILGKIRVKWCLEHRFLPVRAEGDKVLVAFADPLDQGSRQAARRMVGEVAPAVATDETIRHVLSLVDQNRKRVEAVGTDEKTIKNLVETLLTEAVERNASDIHIEPLKDRLRVRLRQDGVLVHHKEFPLELAPAISSRIKIIGNADITERRRHQDGRILFEDPHGDVALDLRVSFFVTVFGEKIVLRLLNQKGEPLDIGQIGMAPRMLERFQEDALDIPSGVVIVTGPTGSGKTTTLYSSVNYLDNIHTCIVTAEDPVEYVIEGICQCSINAKIGVTFEETLRHIVRQDPDIIVLGEIRDHFSAATAIQAALTGHKVLTTFHTEDATGGLLRLLNMDIESFLISSTVLCVVAQRLLRRVCPECGIPYEPTPSDLRRLGYSGDALKGLDFRAGKGCSLCHFTGYKGRVAVFELLVLNELVKDAILKRQTSYEIRRISTETSGLVTLLEDGIAKASKGLTTIQEILRVLPRLDKPRPVAELRRLLGE